MGKKATFLFVNFLILLFTIVVFGVTVAASFANEISPEKNWTLTWISLGLMPLLIVNLILILYWIFRFKIWIILPLVAIAANYDFVSATLQLRSTKSLQIDPDRVKIATYNVHGFSQRGHKNTAAVISELMKREEVDVLCFQEFSVSKEFNIDSMAQMFSFLPYYVTSLDKGGLPLAIFSKYPIRDSELIEFPTSNNGAVWVDIDLSDKWLRVLNIHLQTTNVNQSKTEIADLMQKGVADQQGKQALDAINDKLYINSSKRVEQVEILRNAIAKDDKPTIVCGDFNDTPASYVYTQLTRDLTDGFKECGSGYAYSYRPIYKLLRLDYILHDNKVKGQRYYSLNEDYSDHNPVFLEFGFRY